ncbi:hypothetical protein OHB26_37250 [Nocardia sp. NBC_01503]|uniref:hypothetical protein n=1 Tax=Nocardia sp. NBC_01503 TaxID=2975997 RepID=UPI002E7B47F8|nr:hypothetical protein [Nocardia sp. NBC_01503]WTL32447.1 hypothetical protein OHB26_37250 [Nocardia sp. NBC_01503]
MKAAPHADRAPDTATVPAERPDLTAWRQRHAIRQSNAAQPIPSARKYKRTSKHRNRGW